MSVTLVIGALVLAWLLLRVLTRRGTSSPPSVEAAVGLRPSAPIPARRADPRVGSFGPKCAWIAVRSVDPEAVMHALGFGSSQAAPFGEGANRAYAGEFFVTPPIDGWVLVASVELLQQLTSTDDPADLDLAAASSRFGAPIYAFGSHRIVETHGYLVYDAGRLVRAYVFSGEQGRVLRDEGTRQPFEVAHSVGQDQATLEASWESETSAPALDEVVLFAIAGELSVDPTMLEDRGPLPDGWTVAR